MSRYIIGFLLGVFVLVSWPFISFPLTDGDIANWSQLSVKLLNSGHYLTEQSDQGHGPLMAWTGAWSMMILGRNFFALNFFNALMTVVGMGLSLFFSYKFWKDTVVTQVTGLFFSTSLAVVYLARTPMYDWPATVCYFGFCGFYYLFIRDKKWSYFGVALLFIMVGSISRFSICLGLAGIYLGLLNVVLRRPILVMVREGMMVLFSVILFNVPWLIGQSDTYGLDFIKTFIYDNTGRYVKSTRPDAHFRFDFYGFPLYILVGLLPYTFAFLASVFKKDILIRIKENDTYKMLIIGFLPCFLLFSFSGHTKLVRYIAYVFPFVTLWLAHMMVRYDLKNPLYQRRCGKMIKIGVLLLCMLLFQQLFQFWDQAQNSLLFVCSVFGLLVGLLGVSYWMFVKKTQHFLAHVFHYWLAIVGIYLLFFTILSIEMHRAPFLMWVRDGISDVLTR